jgi:pyridoxal phosphate enzyme (YggS family)
VTSFTAPATSFESRLAAVRTRIGQACARASRDPASVTLIAVTKTMPAAVVLEAYETGLRDFGENRVQEGVAKAADVARILGTRDSDLGPPSWHLIGHLQTNKVRAALGAFAILHAIDSERLLRAIDSAAEGPVSVMLEVNVTGEATKFGATMSEVPELLAVAKELPNIRVTGLMTVAPRVADPEDVRPVFRQLATLAHQQGLPQLSMGMTEDFHVAIEEGATCVRVGRALFGERA